jgi:hypothetical protein
MKEKLVDLTKEWQIEPNIVNVKEEFKVDEKEHNLQIWLVKAGRIVSPRVLELQYLLPSTSRTVPSSGTTCLMLLFMLLT